jgi:Fe-S-cluster-containing hydrogenase component 2
MATVIRIHALAPSKPVPGAACNGCGVCCLAEPCPAGMLFSLHRLGPCRALRWEQDEQAAVRYRCGLMANRLLRPLVARWIAAGQGCDSDAEIVS